MPQVMPEDFYSDSVPPRIIGTETEYIDQRRIANGARYKISIDKEFGEQFSLATGIASCPSSSTVLMLQNGGRLHNDCGLLEYCGPECLGPRQAAAADLAGISIMKYVAVILGGNCDIYRRSGTQTEDIGKADNTLSNTTTGYHENFLVPSSLTRSLIGNPGMLPTYLATRIFAGAGMVGQYGFNIYQKAQGIGESYSANLNTRCVAHNKPMFLLRSAALNNDKDINPLPEWSRIEVRFADPGRSRAGRFLSLAATSLVLRMLEHSEITDESLRSLEFKDPLTAMRRINRDLSFNETFATLEGKRYTALDVQEQLADMAIGLSGMIELPPDEVEGAFLWRQIIDDFRDCDFKEFGFDPIADVVDWAPKLRDLVRKFGSENLYNQNPDALMRDLLWDGVVPERIGARYWAKIGKRQNLISQELIDSLVHTAPEATRAHARGMVIREGKAVKADWSEVIIVDNRGQHQTKHLLSPYSRKLTK